MTSRPRSIPFQKVDVGARPQDGRTADAGPAKLKFSDLLKNRRQAPAAEFDESIGSHEAEPELPAEAEDEAPPEKQRPVHAPTALPSQPEPQQQDMTDGPDREWLESIVPTPDDMEPVLEESRKAHIARAKAVAAAQPQHPMVQGIAQTVTRFCNEKSVDESEGWQVRMPLNRDVLPDTVMQLSISPYWLQLRFETSDELSRNLLITHRDVLTQLIGDSLKRRRDVAISVD